MAPTKGRRRGGRNIRRASAGRKSVHRQVVNSAKGKKIRVPADPPSFCATPWWPITISANIPAPEDKVVCFTVAMAMKAFQAQTGIINSTLALRFQRFRLWELNKHPIFVAVDETVDGSACASQSDTIANLQDWPSAINYARVGYIWPISSRLQSKTQAELSTVLFRFSSRHHLPADILLYLDCLWTVPDTGKDALRLPGMPVKINDESASVSPPTTSPAWEMA